MAIWSSYHTLSLLYYVISHLNQATLHIASIMLPKLPKQIFVTSVQGSKKMTNGLMVSCFIFSFMGIRAHVKKEKSFSWQFMTVYLKIFKSKLSYYYQASCSDFFLKPKLMLSCFQELRHRSLRKKNQISFFMTIQGSEKKNETFYWSPK